MTSTSSDPNLGQRATGSQNVQVTGPIQVNVQINQIASALHQMRSPVPDFVGRKSEIDTLVQGLGQSAVGAIIGRAGVGKTELAYVVAQLLQVTYPDAQIVLNLQGNSSSPLTPEQALQTIISAFEPLAALPDDLSELQGLYRSLLTGKRVLILADEAKDAGQVRGLVPPTGCTMLITSRQRFRLSGMLTLELGTLGAEEAQHLLLMISPRISNAAPRLAELCGYLPLALRISAGLFGEAPYRPIEEHLAILKHEHTRLARLSNQDDWALDMESAITFGYDALDSGAQSVLCQLSIFQTSFDQTAINAVVRPPDNSAEGLEGILDRLHRRRLLDWDYATQRYSLHDLLRVFAASHLDDSRATTLRHVRHYAEIAARADQLYREGGNSAIQGLALFDRERFHIDMGWKWLRSQPSEPLVDELTVLYANATADIGQLRYHNQRERIPQLESALAAAERLRRRDEVSALMGNLGNAYMTLGETRHAIDFYEQALVLAHELGDRRGESADLGNLGLAYYTLGDTNRSIEFSERALAIAREIGDRRGESPSLNNLGLAYADRGDFQRAIHYYENWLSIARELGDRVDEGEALGSLGAAYVDLTDNQRAIYYYELQLAVVREIGDRRSESTALGNLGSALAAIGELEQAISCFDQSLQILLEIGDRILEGRRRRDLARVYRDLGRTDLAIDYYEQTLSISRELGDRRMEGQVLADLGTAHRTLRQVKRAQNYYEQALAIVRRLKDTEAVAATLFSLGSLARETNQLEDAKRYLEESLNIYRRLKNPLESSVASLLDELAVRNRGLFSPIEKAQRFFEGAGFEVWPTDQGNLFMCIPKAQIWQNRFPQPVPLSIVSGRPVDPDTVLAICRVAEEFLHRKPDAFFIIYDSLVTNSGWLQISAKRVDENPVQILPIDAAKLAVGQEKSPQEALEDSLRPFLGIGEDLYYVTNPVTDQLNFVGREGLAADVMNQLRAGLPVALFGLRKIGKSSLLHYVREKFPYPTALVDLQAGIDLADLYQRICGSERGYDHGYELSWSTWIRSKLKEINWTPPDFNRTTDPTVAFTRATRELLGLLAQNAAPPGLCLLVDEVELIFPQSTEGNNTGVSRYLTFARTLRGLVQEQRGRFSLLLCGVDARLVRVDRLADQQNPFYKFFRETYLPALRRTDCINMIRNIGSFMGLSYSDNALEFVADITGGHPFLARLLCSLAFTLQGHSGEISLGLLQQTAKAFISRPGTQDLLNEGGLWGEISDGNLWTPAQAAENQSVLTTLADASPQPLEVLISQAHDLQARERSLDEMLRRTILDQPKETTLDIRLQLFRDWIRRYKLRKV